MKIYLKSPQCDLSVIFRPHHKLLFTIYMSDAGVSSRNTKINKAWAFALSVRNVR